MIYIWIAKNNDQICDSGLFLQNALVEYVGVLQTPTTQIYSFLEVLLEIIIIIMICLLFPVAFYVGLQGACIYDVVGLKNISYGFSILFVALGTSCFMSLPVAGKTYSLDENVN